MLQRENAGDVLSIVAVSSRRMIPRAIVRVTTDAFPRHL